MTPTADQRVQARRHRLRRARVLTLTFVALALAAIPLVLYFIDCPVSLIAAIPLAVMVLWLVLFQRMAR